MTTKQILVKTKAFLMEEGFSESEAEEISKILSENRSSIQAKIDQYLVDKHGIDT